MKKQWSKTATGRLFCLTKGRNMKTSITKILCFAIVLFGTAIGSAAAQMTASSLMANDLICADPATIYPDAKSL